MSSPVQLAERYRAVRAATEALCEPLEPEDFVIQSMDDTSPPKWHLAHTSWFFETFLLGESPAFDPAFAYLFNSYYQSVGRMHPRPRRGLLSRPTIARVMQYRASVDERMQALLSGGERGGLDAQVAFRTELGLHHEQQHQELLLMDLKHNFACNPLAPAYRVAPAAGAGDGERHGPVRWHAYPGGLIDIGAPGGTDTFCFDNETPRHRVHLAPFELASRCVTNAELAAFIDDGGYRRPELWLADGWALVERERWQAPLYWRERPNGERVEMTLHGELPLEPDVPVVHVSYYEADAYATWAGARLPTEHEWELAARAQPVDGNTVETGALHPRPAPAAARANAPVQLFGDVWEWTASPYAAYPGFRPLAGSLGEYNGKFMCNQLVLRGGSCITPRSHLRATYRNFFYPHQRWNFNGVRLARTPRGEAS